MSSAAVRTDAWEVEIETPTHTHQAINEADPNWEETDDEGHVHTYDSRGETWYGKNFGEYWCGFCRAMHKDIRPVCKMCEARVHPGVRPGRPRHMQMPARATGRVAEEADVFGDLMDAVGDGSTVDEVRLPNVDHTVVLTGVFPTEFRTDTFGRRFIHFEASGVTVEGAT